MSWIRGYINETYSNLVIFLQGDQSCAWLKAGRSDAADVTTSHRKHRLHLLYILSNLWCSRRTGMVTFIQARSEGGPSGLKTPAGQKGPLFESGKKLI